MPKPRATFLLLATSAAAAFTVDASAGLTEAGLRTTLRGLRTHLATSPAVLEEAARHAAAGFSITPDDLARESLLSARLVTGLQRVRVGPSGVAGAGDGVFATVDISEGDIVTCYPGDAVMALPPGHDAETASGYGPRHRVTIWGTHVPASLREQATRHMEEYSLNVDAVYAVCGLCALRDEMAYVGHLVNDGARVSRGLGGLSGGAAAAYADASAARRNAGHETLEGCHTVTLATRDIARGDEIFVTYGHRFWRSRLQRRNEGINHVLSGLL